MAFIRKHHLLLFFLTWFILNFIQAWGTELFDDEAYYWIYSKFPDWGYFDHPPMIALVIRAGYFLFHNELGVRFFIVLLSTATLYIIYQLLPRKNAGLFYAIACSIALFQFGSILAVPDIPMAFFVAVFFLAYKNFLARMSITNSVLLGLVMALMLYTKYHGILVILCTILSNPKLVTNGRAYLAAGVGILLFTPHFYWQYTHGFPSVQYHLFERSAPHYKFIYSLEYILGQLILPGPFIGWLLILAAFRYKIQDRFERGLKFSLAGIYIFFLISTLKGRVEANWTIPVFIPLLILSHQYLLEQTNWRKLLLRFVPVTLIIVVIVRIYMIVDVMPVKFIEKDEFHKSRQWADSISVHAGKLPVVFLDSYQQASKYWFYSGEPGFSLNTPTYRRNNFNYWPLEDSIRDKKIVVLWQMPDGTAKKIIRTPRGELTGFAVDSFFSFSKLRAWAKEPIVVQDGWSRDCTIHFSVPGNYLSYFQRSSLKAQSVDITLEKDDVITHRFSTNIRLGMIRTTEATITTNFPVNLPRGLYTVFISLPTSLKNCPSLNSTGTELIVK